MAIYQRLPFKSGTSLSQRKEVSRILLERYPGRIPVIVEPYQDMDPPINRHKFLPPDSITMGAFVFELRQHMKSLRGGYGLTFYALATNLGAGPSMKLLSMPSLMSTIYDEYKHEDGFLYLIYITENVFG